jgi:RNA polymerase sigma-70 factor (ECF subfamily)
MDPRISQLLEPHRPYLKLLAQIHLDRRLRGKLDPSDVVQQTFLRACAGAEELRDHHPQVVIAWLRKILARTLGDAVRDLERVKRDVRREQSIEAALENSASGLEAWVAADETSPSQKAEKNEQLIRLVAALMELPDLIREAVVLKHCQGWTVAQIAERIERTPAAVASLLRRGLQQLRTELRTGDLS